MTTKESLSLIPGETRVIASDPGVTGSGIVRAIWPDKTKPSVVVELDFGICTTVWPCMIEREETPAP